MKVLIVGGTIFLGRRLVEAALARGHRVTTFTRGRHDADLGAEKLRGDRNSDVSALEGTQWDAVIDTCGYVPSGVARVIDAIGRESIGHYTFVSSVSVYADCPPEGIDENGRVSTMTASQVAEAEQIASPDRLTGRAFGELYGPLKVLCEHTAERRMSDRVLNVRPGLIVGAHDYMDRLPYWVRRVAHGGTVLAPGRPGRRVRVIDASDLAAWIVLMAERGTVGTFNATGAEDGLTMEGLLKVCRDVSGSDARLEWVPEDWLLQQGVGPWNELPLWIPESENGIFEVRNDRAIAAGLTFRPLTETVADVLAWDRTRPQHESLKAGITREREEQLLGDAPHSAH